MNGFSKYFRQKRWVYILGFLIVCASCNKEDEENIEPQVSVSTVAGVDITYGNFSINSRDLTTVQDGIGTNYYADYVNESTLPQALFQSYYIVVYIPSDLNNFIAATDNVQAVLSAGGSTHALNASSDFLETLTFGGQTYAAFGLEVNDFDGRAYPDNFNNIVFSFDRIHKDKDTDEVLSEATNRVEVFKRSDTTGGDGGGTANGQVAFWLDEDCGCGNIEVSINGTYSGQVTQFFTSGTPDCGESGALTIDLAPGTYNFSAECSDRTWNGTVTSTAYGCTLSKLNC